MKLNDQDVGKLVKCRKTKSERKTMENVTIISSEFIEYTGRVVKFYDAGGGGNPVEQYAIDMGTNTMVPDETCEIEYVDEEETTTAPQIAELPGSQYRRLRRFFSR